MWKTRDGYKFHAIASMRIFPHAGDWIHAGWCAWGMAAAGDTAALQSMWARGSYVAIPTLGSIAAAGNHLDTLLWVLEHGVAFDAKELAVEAAAGGATDVLQWVWDRYKREVGFDEPILCGFLTDISTAALTRATENTRCLEWMRGLAGVTFPHPEDAHALSIPAESGNLGALRWLVEEAGLKVKDLSAARAAAAGGHLAVLAYLHEVGPAFDDSVADACVCLSRAPSRIYQVRDASHTETQSWIERETGCVTRWARQRAAEASAAEAAAEATAERGRGQGVGQGVGAAARAWGVWDWLRLGRARRCDEKINRM
jgi:hypothetical protein